MIRRLLRTSARGAVYDAMIGAVRASLGCEMMALRFFAWTRSRAAGDFHFRIAGGLCAVDRLRNPLQM